MASERTANQCARRGVASLATAVSGAVAAIAISVAVATIAISIAMSVAVAAIAISVSRTVAMSRPMARSGVT
jgi:hypothetical protein